MGVGVVKSLSKTIGDELYNEMCDIGNLYLIGGSLRDFKDCKSFDYSRDIDIVVDVRNNENWKKFVNKRGKQKNKFGGYKITLDNAKIDIWSIDKTWAYMNKKVKCERTEYASKLNKTVFLNIDAIYYDVTKKKFHDYAYKKAIRSNVLDIVLADNPEIDLNIARTIALKIHYKLDYSAQLEEFIRKHALNDIAYCKKIYKIINKRYKGTSGGMTEKQVCDELTSIFSRKK